MVINRQDYISITRRLAHL